jgi:hypothetical protein
MLLPRPTLIAKNAFAIAMLVSMAGTLLAQTSQCAATSGANITPVIDLYTSEGCSSCPPADKWASTFKEKSAAGEVVVQTFHVGYWDYIGWVDRFAAPAYTQRQREVASKNNLRGIYTPQAVLNGKDWPDWHARAPKALGQELAKASIALKQIGVDQFEASVMPLPAMQGTNWSAYWTVTEHGHNSKVRSGENAGEVLKHDFVVRQLVQAGQYEAGKSDAAMPQKLTLRSIAPTRGHARQVNLVLFETSSGKTLQALSLQCATPVLTG